ncbi:hypothetical protein DFH07DRAFT_842271 [Mycena maculata]|uniref:MYND-type domain-containing protein n=1 Tax=Mycena maculata TaxID=230809 RepID=A0AAD7I9P3_9AGAR|nr:hypothetical protein DFH07DRAFT_842271 [Mycena maculata]
MTAAAAGGSIKHLAVLCTAFLRPDTPQDHLVRFLPALYPHLDPAPIPRPDELDRIISANISVPCIKGAMLALNALAGLSRLRLLPVGAAPDLWPRVWKWIDFVHTYWEYLPEFLESEEAEMCMNNAAVLMRLAEDERTARKIYATCGVRFLFARAWKILLEFKPPLPEVEPDFQDAGGLLSILTRRMDTVENTLEVLDALGGIDGLATTVVAHITRGNEIPKSEMTVLCQSSAITFLKERGHSTEFLHAALLSKGVVPALVAALLGLKKVVLPRTHFDMMIPTRRYCFDELLKYMRSPPGYPHVTQALEAGLLDVITWFGAMATPNDPSSIYPHLQELLCHLLPAALVYCSVVAEMKKQLKTVVITSEFKRSPIFSDWEIFGPWAEGRVKIFDAWDKRHGQSFAACDNMQCGKIDRKERFKRCGTCQSVRYCSKQCQATDWHDGHREVCDELRSVRNLHTETLSRRERSFMRALLDHDYEELIYNVSYLQIKFIHEHPGEPFFTRFNYTRSGGVPIEIHPTQLLQAQGALAVEVPTRLARAARSGGRLGMHVMFVGEGTNMRVHLFPHRAASARFHESLHRMGKNLPAGANFSDVFPILHHDLSALINTRESSVKGIHS